MACSSFHHVGGQGWAGTESQPCGHRAEFWVHHLSFWNPLLFCAPWMLEQTRKRRLFCAARSQVMILISPLWAQNWEGLRERHQWVQKGEDWWGVSLLPVALCGGLRTTVCSSRWQCENNNHGSWGLGKEERTQRCLSHKGSAGSWCHWYEHEERLLRGLGV